MSNHRPAHITRAKLDEATVRELRRRAANGVMISVMARELGLDRHTVGDAIRGKSWRHVR